MKTDRVLTMTEYLDQCCVVPRHVDPPACHARHISISAEEEVDLGRETDARSCARRGHHHGAAWQHWSGTKPLALLGAAARLVVMRR